MPVVRGAVALSNSVHWLIGMNTFVRPQARFITKQFLKDLALKKVVTAIWPSMAPVYMGHAAWSLIRSGIADEVKDRLESFVERRKLPHWPAELMRMDDPYESGPRVFVVAAKAEDLTPYLLRTYDMSSDTGAVKGSRECAVWEAGMATSAAPTYFPSVRLRSGVQLVDGGVAANNSVRLARQEATLQIPEWIGRSIGCIVSLGCGRQMPSVRSEGTMSGQALWGAIRLVKLFREAATETENTHQNMLAELGQPSPTTDSKWWWKSGSDHPNHALRDTLYARINPEVQYPSEIEMDTKDDQELDALQRSAERWNGFADCVQEREELKQKLLSRGAEPGLRILSIDGGGIKGLIPAIVIQKIEELCDGRPVHELFDLVCGTSTGGILALGTCVAKRPVAEMIDVYRNRATEIWTKRWSYVPAIGTGMCAKYEPAFLRSILQARTVRARVHVTNGIAVLGQAMDADGQGKHAEAITLYTDGLQQLLLAVKLGESSEQSLQAHFAQYLGRLEQLKQAASHCTTSQPEPEAAASPAEVLGLSEPVLLQLMGEKQVPVVQRDFILKEIGAIISGRAEMEAVGNADKEMVQVAPSAAAAAAAVFTKSSQLITVNGSTATKTAERLDKHGNPCSCDLFNLFADNSFALCTNWTMVSGTHHAELEVLRTQKSDIGFGVGTPDIRVDGEGADRIHKGGTWWGVRLCDGKFVHCPAGQTTATNGLNDNAYCSTWPKMETFKGFGVTIGLRLDYDHCTLSVLKNGCPLGTCENESLRHQLSQGTPLCFAVILRHEGDMVRITKVS
jgi:predicted acylesterase/phospholipase RssA